MDESFLKSVIAIEPKTLNALQVNEFRVVFSRIPNIVYFCQKANLPGLALNETIQPAPFATPIRRPMGGLTYDNFEMEFIVAENMDNWKELHKWVTAIPPTIDGSSYAKYKDNFSDATLIVMNSMSKPFFAVHFRECYPTAISSMDFMTTVNDISPVLCTASFAYTGYYVEDLTTS